MRLRSLDAPGYHADVAPGLTMRRTIDMAPGNLPHLARRPKGGEFKDYTAEVGEGMVVLDAVHQIQATQAPDLACRWNCKAGKCGSCSAEINGMPKLMCMTRLERPATPTSPIIVEPMQAFPPIKDLVTDVSWNYEVKKLIKPFQPRKPDNPDGTWRMQQEDADRVQEFRKCIECFLCQDVCHVLRDHHKHAEFIGPRFLVHAAQLEMNPLDTADRVPELKKEYGIGYCNITKCCTKVCPEHITITDNAIIPLKERVVDEFYDPVMKLIQLVFRPRKKEELSRRSKPMGRSTLLASRRRHAMFELKSLTRDAIPAALEKAAPLPAAQRAGAGREHLRGRAPASMPRTRRRSRR